MGWVHTYSKMNNFKTNREDIMYFHPYPPYTYPYFRHNPYSHPIHYVPIYRYPHEALSTPFIQQPGRQPDPFPQVDLKVFNQSLVAFQALMKQANIILDKLGHSPDLSLKLMNAAQRGNQAEVERLVKSTGVQAKVATSYTPSRVQFILYPDSQDAGSVTLNIKWSNN